MKTFYKLLKKYSIALLHRCGLLQQLPGTDRQALEACEQMTRSINRATTYAQLKVCEDWCKLHILWKYHDSEYLYNILINHIQLRRCEIAAEQAANATCS